MTRMLGMIEASARAKGLRPRPLDLSLPVRLLGDERRLARCC
ncbi:MAG: hypothetical protein U1F53_19275 [Burkholderiaceae bacterium]